MARFIKVLAASLVAVVCGAGSASAQNVIRNSGNGNFNTLNVQGSGFGTNKVIGSGNGTGNTINVGGGFGGFGFGMTSQNVIRNSGNGSFNTINVGGTRPMPVGFDRNSWSPFPVQPMPVYPVSPWGWQGGNQIINSGNGTGNTINAGGIGGFLGGFVQSAFPNGVNLNVVKNSGNGTGNAINLGGSRPGALNFNVISGSGNGTGNTIRTRP